MIRRLLHYCSPRARRLVLAELGFIVVTALLQGIAFLLLVPLLRAVFAGDTASVRPWLIALILTGVGCAATHWVASQLGLKASTAVLESLLNRLGDRLIELPIAWFGADRSGMIAGIATQGAMFVSTTPYAILRLILTGFITPGTVLVGMYFFDWRLALAMTVMIPVILLGYRWLSRKIGEGDAVHSVAVADASNRVIEFARAQPALRTAGDESVADRLVAEALSNQHHAYRGMLVTGGTGIASFAGIVQLSLTVLLVVGANLAIGGSVDIATLIALLVLGVRFNEPIVTAGDLGGGISVARTTLDQLDALEALQDCPSPQRRPPRPTGASSSAGSASATADQRCFAT
ncbi:MAG: ABC transporter transmembrane domain-containing protein [Propionicimonas sp.]